MKLGLIGKPLGHSWSPEIHRYFLGNDADYGLWELDEKDLAGFFAEREFDGINITIPYKQESIKYLDELDETAGRLQAVNCVVNDRGVLKGYNTDVSGLERMVKMHAVNKEGGIAAILGSGGAALAAREVTRRMGWECLMVSRRKHGDCIDYDEFYEMGDNFTLLINATPLGMLPDTDANPVDLDRLSSLRYVIDIIANPVRTSLVLEAEERGIAALGGLQMLVAQALASDELFAHGEMDDSRIAGCMNSICNEKLNIVLTGMPSCGKSTIGARLAEVLHRSYCDMDDEIVKQTGMSVADYFRERGENAFRDLESELCKSLTGTTGMVISTGGGVVKRPENMRRLAHNGRIVWIDRDIDKLVATDSRPLSRSQSDLEVLYEERRELYEKYSDIRISNNEDTERALKELIKALGLTGESSII